MEEHKGINESPVSKRQYEIRNQDRERIYYKTRKILYYILGIIEFILGFRFLLKMLGANPASWFVDFIYTISGIFIAPFRGIMGVFTVDGFERQAVVEPSTIFAMLIYAVVVWGIVRLVDILTSDTTAKAG